MKEIEGTIIRNISFRSYEHMYDIDHNLIESEFYAVGLDGVIKITEHPAQGEGDKWFWNIHFANGTIVSLFHCLSITRVPAVEEAK